MALEYFLYTTNFNNTLIDRSDTSFVPLPPDTGEILIDFFIPKNQPLYLYRESGSTIIENDEQTIQDYLDFITPPTDDEIAFNTYTATTQANINFISGATNNKIDKITTGTTGNFPTIASGGALVDSNFNFNTFNRNIEKQLIVDINGNGDFTSVSDAVLSITASSVSNRFGVYIMPGLYTEPPFTIPPFTDMVGLGARLRPTNENSDFITISSGGLIDRLIIDAPSGSTNFGLVANESLVRNIFIVNGSNGINVVDSGGALYNVFVGLSASTFSLTGTALKISSGVETSVDSSKFYGDNIGIDIESNGILNLSNSTTSADQISGTGIYLRENANLDFQGITVENEPNVGLVVESGATIAGDSAVIDDFNDIIETHVDVKLGGIVKASSVRLNASKVILPFGDTDKVNIDFDTDVIEKDKQQRVFIKDFAVGSPVAQRTTGLGEGLTSPSRLLVFTSNPGGTNIVDVSKEAASPDGTGFTFQSNTSGEIIYSSTNNFSSETGDFTKYFGVDLIYLQQAIASSAQDVVFEYWNGSSWVEIVIMVTQGFSPFLPQGNVGFISPIERVRYNARIDDNWVKNDPISSGTDRFWTRARLVNPLTQLPIFQQLKLHVNSSIINGDGWSEYLGKARPIGRLPFDYNNFAPANNSPSNQDIYLAQILGVGRFENEFVDGVTDRAGLVTYLPFDADTSTPVRLQWSYFTDDNSGGDIIWNIRSTYSLDGNPIFGTAASAPTIPPNTFTNQQIVDPAPSANVQKTLSIDIDVSDLVSRKASGFGDLLWITIERQGGSGSDTHSGNVAVMQLIPYYLKWCEGGHL